MSAEGTYCVGHAVRGAVGAAARQARRVDARRRRVDAVPPPEPDDPLLDRGVVARRRSSPSSPLPARGVPAMSLLAEQPGHEDEEREGGGEHGGESGAVHGALAPLFKERTTCRRSAPDVTCASAPSRAKPRPSAWARMHFPSPSIAKPAVSTGLSERGRRKDGDPPWRTDAPCRADFFCAGFPPGRPIRPCSDEPTCCTKARGSARRSR